METEGKQRGYSERGKKYEEINLLWSKALGVIRRDRCKLRIAGMQ